MKEPPIFSLTGKLALVTGPSGSIGSTKKMGLHAHPAVHVT